METTLERSGEDVKTTLVTSGKVQGEEVVEMSPSPQQRPTSPQRPPSVDLVKNTLETSGKHLKTTLETSGKDTKTTLETSGKTSGKDLKTTLGTSVKI